MSLGVLDKVVLNVKPTFRESMILMGLKHVSYEDGGSLGLVSLLGRGSLLRGLVDVTFKMEFGIVLRCGVKELYRFLSVHSLESCDNQ